MLALPLADQHRVLDRPVPLQRVEGQVGDHRLHREERVLRIIFGAEQPALLGGPRGEDKRPLRPRPGRELAAHLDHRRKAERVVGGAGPDRPALRIRRRRCRRRPNGRRS